MPKLDIKEKEKKKTLNYYTIKKMDKKSYSRNNCIISSTSYWGLK